jgi:hypothetical protein
VKALGKLCLVYQELLEACRGVLCDIRSAQSSNGVTYTLSCLKNGKGFALRIIIGYLSSPMGSQIVHVPIK